MPRSRTTSLCFGAKFDVHGGLSGADTDIVAKLYDFMAYHDHSPLPAPQAMNPGVLTSTIARRVLFDHLYTPHTWGIVAEVFADIMYHSNPTKLHDLAHSRENL